MMGKKSAESRLAAFLITMAARLKACGYSGCALKLSMPRHDIGNHLSLSMETISRTLTRLQVSGVLEVHRRRVIIRDFDNLSALANMPPRHVDSIGKARL
jgi:CRP/FNR family transcriptional regulator